MNIFRHWICDAKKVCKENWYSFCRDIKKNPYEVLHLIWFIPFVLTISPLLIALAPICLSDWYQDKHKVRYAVMNNGEGVPNLFMGTKDTLMFVGAYNLTTDSKTHKLTAMCFLNWLDKKALLANNNSIWNLIIQYWGYSFTNYFTGDQIPVIKQKLKEKDCE